MLTDLVSVTTHDGITLTGAYFAPADVAQPPRSTPSCSFTATPATSTPASTSSLASAWPSTASPS